MLKKMLMFNNTDFIFKSITKKVTDPMGRAAIKYAEPHFVTAYSGEFYKTSKLQTHNFQVHIGREKVLILTGR